MKRLWRGTDPRSIALFAMLLAAAAARPAGAAVKIDTREIMPVSEVRAGMVGYGRTVFSGVKIETFKVKVLGILPKENLGRPLILVRMDGGPISQRGANIIAGMSGSPVYINGRMIGAVAYGQTFPREPIAMLTPIEDMLEALDPALPSKPAMDPLPKQDVSLLTPPQMPGEKVLSTPLTIEGKTYDRIRVRPEPLRMARADRVAPGTLEMAPVDTPLMVAGVSARNLSRLSDALKPFGVEATPGPGSMKYDKPVPMVPGSAVGASLVTGDVDMTAVGTLTYRKGDQVLAFGHPFLPAGAVDFPLTSAWVHDVFPSVMRSFKIASPIKTIGSIRQDRPWGIAGIVGRMPQMIPVEATVRDFGTGRSKTIRASVVDNRFLTPQLIATVADEAVARVHTVPGDATARVHTRILTKEFGAIERDNVYYDPMSIDAAALGDLMSCVSILSSNPWQRVDVRGVKMDVEIVNSHRTAVIERAVVDREKYEPGDTVQVEVQLRPWEREPVERTLQVKIPDYAPNGRVTLRVAGGGGSAGILLGPIGGAAGSPNGGTMPRLGPSPLPPATSLKQLIDSYRDKESNNDLVATLALPTYTGSVEGQKMHTLPPNLLDVMRSPRNSGMRLQPDEVKSKDSTPWVISGAALVQLSIERRSYADKPTAPTPGPGPMPTPPTAGQPPQPTFDSDPDMPDGTVSVRTRQSTDDDGDVDLSDPDAAATAAAGSGEEAPKPPTPAGAAAQQPDAPGAGDSSAKPPAATAPIKPAGRMPAVWRQNTPETFSRGKLTGVAVTSRGEVALARPLEKLQSLDASYVWSLLSTKGVIYAGTGDHGVLYRIEGGKVTPVLKSPELQVLALARDAAGNIYAGTAPHGWVYRITPDGKSDVFWRSPEEYILSLAVDSRGNVYAATSPKGGIYRINPQGQGALLAQIPDPFAISLACVGDTLYAAGGSTAAVYRISANGKVSGVYDPGEGSTASVIAAGPAGRLYVGTAPKGMIVAVDADGDARVLQDRAPAGVTAIGVDGKGVVWASAGSILYRVEDNGSDPVIEHLENKAAPKLLSLAIDEDGNVGLGTATGEVYSLSAQLPRDGEFESTVRDAGSVARWGRLRWIARTPAGTHVTLQTRTGNSGEPDETWSPWSADYTESGKLITSPAGRYIQYRIKMTADGTARPVVSDVSISYMGRNQPPKLVVSAPKGGEVWGKKQTIRWTGSDPDNDTLVYDVYVSSDNGTTWTKLDAPAVPAKPGSAPANGAKQPEDAAKPANGAAKPGAETTKPSNGTKRKDFKDMSLSWDTADVPDGRYLVKVVASDRLANPTDALSVERVVGPVQVCNAAPKLLMPGAPAVNGDRTVRVDGKAEGGSAIIGVDYRVDDDEWASAKPADGIFDSDTESFEIVTSALDPGEHTIEVRAEDAAGNHVEDKRKVTVR